ncbi:MAG TPA: DNRLRE domain-containing protein, partial [Candidatus Methanoperedens sp.]
NLEPDTTYYYITESFDPNGKYVQSVEKTFRTLYAGKGWRDGFDDESRISSKQSVVIENGDVKLAFSSNQVNPAKDARISPIKERNSGTEDLAVGDSDKYRTVMEFELPDAIKEIDSIKLNLYVSKVFNPTYGQEISLYLLKDSFDEYDVNWEKSKPAKLWNNAGGDFEPSKIDHKEMTGDVSGKWISFTLKGADADNSLNTAKGGDTIALMLKPSVSTYDPRSDWFGSKETEHPPYIDIVPALMNGSIESEDIILPGPGMNYRFYANYTLSSQTNIKFSIIDSKSGNMLCTNIVNEANISNCIDNAVSVRLRADLETANISNTPVLHDWKIGQI